MPACGQRGFFSVGQMNETEYLMGNCHRLQTKHSCHVPAASTLGVGDKELFYIIIQTQTHPSVEL